jgi:hypothetical protein
MLKIKIALLIYKLYGLLSCDNKTKEIEEYKIQRNSAKNEVEEVHRKS